MISPTSATVTSGENECAALATAIVCVTGPLLVDVSLESVEDAERAALDVAEAVTKSWADTATTNAANTDTNLMSADQYSKPCRRVKVNRNSESSFRGLAEG